MSYADRFRTDAPPPPPSSGRGSSSSSNEMSTARLTRLIERACNPVQHAPNFALNLEVVDAINQKKGQFPRQAAVEIVKLINSRTPQTQILALGLLDFCVKNCGYPFHLQVSRKEFLNELVRKFPEKPPIQYSRAMVLILEQIEFWKETICKTSKHRDDLGYVRDMHRLLEYKGYIFPEVNAEDAQVLGPNDNQIRTAAEIEQEERDAQEAKLQELIRRGTPRDLQEANRLMGIMTGYKKDSEQVDYHARAAKDLDKLRRKGDLLEEMLSGLEPGQPLPAETDDVYGEIADQLKSAQPKITRIINDNAETDEDAMVKLLALNDYIHSLVTKYDLLKSAQYDQANQIAINRPSGAGTDASKRPNATKQQVIDSLIDIDDDGPPAPVIAQPSHEQSENLIDALDGLSFGNIALSGTSSPSPSPSHLASLSTSQSLPPAPQTAARQPSPFDIFDAPQTAKTSAAAAQKTVTVSNSTLKIVFAVTSSSSSERASLHGTFTNQSPLRNISNLVFQLAVPKSYKLEMDPISGDSIRPASTGDKVTQSVTITPCKPGLKLKWQVSYNLGSEPISESGLVEHVL